jgi:prefoldin subunit 5
MEMNKKIITGIGALLITVSATGAVAFADTTTATTNPSTTVSTDTTGTAGTTSSASTDATGRKAYAAQIKAERQQIQSLEGQRKQLNQQISADFKSLKGQHLKKNDSTDYQAIMNTHGQILGARAQLDTDDAADLLDLQSKNWAKLTTDLQTKATNLQGLITLKQQQLQNLQNALAHIGGSSSTGSSTSSSSAQSNA